MSQVNPLPAGPRLIPYLTVRDAAAALDFYVRAFGMKELYRLEMPDGAIGHAELELGGALLSLSEEFPSMDVLGPAARGGTTVALTLYVEDVDAAAAQAVSAGATLEGEITDQFYGDRTAKLRDPFGHRWFLHSRVEELSTDELKRRFQAAVG